MECGSKAAPRTVSQSQSMGGSDANMSLGDRKEECGELCVPPSNPKVFKYEKVLKNLLLCDLGTQAKKDEGLFDPKTPILTV